MSKLSADLREAANAVDQLRSRLQMIYDGAKDGASLTWIRAVADEGLRGEKLGAPIGHRTDDLRSIES